MAEDEESPDRFLIQAAIYNNAELLNCLLNGNEKCNIDCQDSFGRTPLYTALTNQSRECFISLLENGASPYIPCYPDHGGMTTLHKAAGDGNVEFLQLMIEYGVDITVKDMQGNTPLMLAKQNNHQICVTELEEALRRRAQKNRDRLKALYEACQNGDVQVFKVLLENLGAEAATLINSVPAQDATLLNSAVLGGQIEILQSLLDVGVQPQPHPTSGDTCLHTACEIGNRGLVKLLLQRVPALVQMPNLNDQLPIHVATTNGHEAVVSVLLYFKYPDQVLLDMEAGVKIYKAPFNINMNDSNKNTPIHLAVQRNFYKVAETILKYTVPYTARDPRRTSSTGSQNADNRSSRTGSSSSSQSQSDSGGSWKSDGEFSPVILDLENNENQTPLHCAVANRFLEMARLLIKYEADVNQLMKRGHANMSPLLIAFKTGSVQMMNVLLQNGAKDFDNEVLHQAISSKQDSLISEVLKHKSHVDTEHKVNRKAAWMAVMPENNETYETYDSLAFSQSLHVPSFPVAINWHDLNCLSEIRTSWLLSAAYLHNPKLKLTADATLPNALFAITRIDVSHNKLTSLPSDILQMHSLRLLNASHNAITIVNKPMQKTEVWQCSTLEEVNLHNNKLREIPVELLKQPSLSKLDVSHNEIEEVPEELWKASKLVELNASYNKIKEVKFPASRLDQSSGDVPETVLMGGPPKNDNQQPSNKDTETDDIEHRPAEQHLFWKDQIEVRETIQNNGSTNKKWGLLKDLNLSHNLLDKVPEGLPCLAPNLQKLNLSYNEISDIGPPWMYPARLKWLDLTQNKLRAHRRDSNLSLTSTGSRDSMSSSFDKFGCYSVVPVPDRKASAARSPGYRGSIPAGELETSTLCIHQKHLSLEFLKTLVLAKNGLKTIQFTLNEYEDYHSKKVMPSRLLPSSSGQYDDKNGGKGQDKPMYPNLSMLDLSSNSFINLPQSVAVMANLTTLNLKDNKIKELPPEMGRLKKIWNLDLKNNPLSGQLNVMVDQKTKTADIIGYLGSILDEAKPYSRMKLMLVGPEKIGKTTLLSKLKSECRRFFDRRETEPVHWQHRVIQKGPQKSVSTDTQGSLLPTVGVDISDLTIEQKGKKVTFKTWDFAGQKEYYATHQYFLSKRSLYLVLWKITDGEKAVTDIKYWLVNIQARAPNSPVIIVGTHLDKVSGSKSYPKNYLPDLLAEINRQFINISEPEKLGLPQVKGQVQVSNTKKSNIKKLVDTIHETVFSLKQPGSSSGLLLEQKVPAKYIELEDVVSKLADERVMEKKDPVLHADQYHPLVMEKMEDVYQRSFRDKAELNQATQFLHDNGVLLHYNDVSLNNMYFLDPQWLCDMLAHVVTVREINSMTRFGVMMTDDLRILFRQSAFKPEDIKEYIINLLNKFEVALLWDKTHLLIPSLLPTEEQVIKKLCDVRIPLKTDTQKETSRTSLGRAKMALPRVDSIDSTTKGRSTFYTSIVTEEQPRYQTIFNKSISYKIKSSASETVQPQVEFTCSSNPAVSLRRLYLMTYIPCGFWSRLITRLLGDRTIHKSMDELYKIPGELTKNKQVEESLKETAEWQCWQTGLQLILKDIGTTVLRVKEVFSDYPNAICDYKQCTMKWQDDGDWRDLKIKNMAILEILVPNDCISIKSLRSDAVYPVHPTPTASAQLMALTVEHIDMLLEDWYPDLGVRFVHSSDGTYLVTRVIPCTKCLIEQQAFQSGSTPEKEKWSLVSREKEPQVTEHIKIRDSKENPLGDHAVYCFMVEHVIQLIQKSKALVCPKDGHGVTAPIMIATGDGVMQVSHISPDLVFDDLGEKYHVTHVKTIKFLGRGSFGAVFKGEAYLKQADLPVPAALKMLEPVPPGDDAPSRDVDYFQHEERKWKNDPTRCACTAYTTARQELNILWKLEHPNIVSLIGICMQPMCLVLDLAPMGDLKSILKDYKRSGTKVPAFVLKKIVIQVASALQYLHSHNIIYRDLKAENILVWSMPTSFEIDIPTHDILVKLADYGVSRAVLPNAAKGYAGTPAFIAPEILKHAGDEVYTEKVDCHSFGIFMYEMVSLRKPYHHIDQSDLQETVLSGKRPLITQREISSYSPYILDLMAACWSHDAQHRPSAAQIVSIASTPEFAHLRDVVKSGCHLEVRSACVVIPEPEEPAVDLDDIEWSSPLDLQEDVNEPEPQRSYVWLSLAADESGVSRTELQVWKFEDCQCIESQVLHSNCGLITCMCTVEDNVWLADDRGVIYMFSSKTNSEIKSFSPFDTNVEVLDILFHVEKKVVLISFENGIVMMYDPIDTCAHSKNERPIPKWKCEGSKNAIRCIGIVKNKTDEQEEIWCGRAKGFITIWPFGQSCEHGDEVNHNYPPQDFGDVYMVKTCKDEPGSLWSYIYPGSLVYKWDTGQKKIAAQIDVSRCIPDLQKKNKKYPGFEGQLDPGSCQVTCLSLAYGNLHIGTTWGCIVVTDQHTMKPLQTFRNHTNNIAAILPLTLQKGKAAETDAQSGQGNQATTEEDSESCIVSVARGCRLLIEQHLGANTSKPMREDNFDKMPFLMTWRAKDWKYY